jgi:hypothetical protein
MVSGDHITHRATQPASSDDPAIKGPDGSD